MGRVDIALIGGTGIGPLLQALGSKPVTVPTRCGAMNGLLFSHQGVNMIAIQRHSRRHRVPPHAINYKAMALGVKALRVKGCFSTAAVGSLRPETTIGTLFACTSFIDQTNREQTLFEQSVQHVPMDPGMSRAMAECVLAAGRTQGVPVTRNGIYLGGNGPRYETPAEIKMMAGMGGDVVGMTASTEAILMAEAGVPYSCLAIVTNQGTGLSDRPVDHAAVVKVMETKGPQVVTMLLEAAVAFSRA